MFGMTGPVRGIAICYHGPAVFRRQFRGRSLRGDIPQRAVYSTLLNIYTVDCIRRSLAICHCVRNYIVVNSIKLYDEPNRWFILLSVALSL